MVLNSRGSLRRPKNDTEATEAYKAQMATLIGKLDKELDSKLSGEEANWKFGSICHIPGPGSQETVGIQPLFFWILKHIACLLDHKQPLGQPVPEIQAPHYSPPKKSVVRESAVVGLDKASYTRFGDIAKVDVRTRP